MSVLERGGKRIRGSLVMLGYEMSGGADKEMITQAARAIEMLHAYILIVDDIQDRSEIRRGGPSAHFLLADEHHKRGFAGDGVHFGVAIALNAALSGAHAAQTILANLDTDVENIRKVLSIVNRTMLVTSHGQTSDIVNEVSVDVSKEDIERVLEWKTAHYSFWGMHGYGVLVPSVRRQTPLPITRFILATGCGRYTWAFGGDLKVANHRWMTCRRQTHYSRCMHLNTQIMVIRTL